jgi:hypothetical protein
MPRALLWLLAAAPAFAQMCAPVRMLPAGAVSGTLDGSSCQLSDATAYAAYRLDLPVRGQLSLALSTASNLILIVRDATGAQIATGLTIQRPIEAGSYLVLVDARVPGQAGQYQVKTAFTAEPGSLCSAFPSLGLSQTVAGTLGASGCAAPNGSPYEAYWLNTYGAGTLTVTATSSDFTSVVTIRDTSGSPIASGQGSASAQVDDGSQYQIVIGTADKTGNYQVTTAFQAAASETCLPTQNLTASTSASASINANSCFAALPGSGDLFFYNYYTLTAGAAGVADIAVSSSDFIPTLYLYDASGNLLSSDTGGGASTRSATASEIRLQLAPGNYTVQLVSSVASGGNYKLAYQFTPGAPQPCATARLAPAGSAAGNLSAASCRTALGLADIYSVTLPAAGTLQLTLNANNTLASAVAIRDAKDNLIVVNQDFEGVGMTQVSANLPAGSYTVLAAAASGAGGYQLASQFTAQPPPPCAAPQSLSVNGGYVQNLGWSGCTGANGQPLDYFQFTLPADSTIAAFMISSDLDGSLTLTDSSGNPLRTDTNSYGYNDPMIVQWLPAGTYQLAARASTPAAGGLYEVDLRTAPGPRPPFCSPIGSLAAGGSASGTIGFSSCQYSGAFADLYQVQLASDATIDLRLNSTDFDAYLILLDAQGNLVAQDDDSGGGTNSRIQTMLAAGKYYVVAKPNGGYTATGAYTVTLAVQ